MSDLCPECGASWDCEHRPKKALDYVADPYGPPVAVERPEEPVNKVELEDRIMTAVADQPGRKRDELARECKSAERRGSAYEAAKATDRFKATIKRLTKDKLLIETTTTERVLRQVENLRRKKDQEATSILRRLMRSQLMVGTQSDSEKTAHKHNRPAFDKALRKSRGDPAHQPRTAPRRRLLRGSCDIVTAATQPSQP